MHMIAAAALTLTLMLALPAAAQTPIAEASGNWAGPSGQGFDFLAELYQEEDRLGLVIWQRMGGIPEAAGNPQFKNSRIELGAFATSAALEVVDIPNGSILQITVEFADQEAEGRSVTQIQYLDNQFTVTGYYHRSRPYNPGGTPIDYECDVDLWNGVTIDNGPERKLEPMDFEALNASDWTYGAAFDRGFCTRAE